MTPEERARRLIDIEVELDALRKERDRLWGFDPAPESAPPVDVESSDGREYGP